MRRVDEEALAAVGLVFVVLVLNREVQSYF